MKNRPYLVVVDDDLEMLQMLRHILELERYDVATVADCRSALAILKKCKPDLVILDIMMPELDDYQVLDLIRQRFDFPIILLTASNEETSLNRALGLGEDDYVRKPFRTRELLARIRAKLKHA